MGTLQDLARLAFSLAQRALAGDLEIPGQGQGDLLEYDGIAWSPLPPGAAGEVLTSNGPGADPSYQAGASPGPWISLAPFLQGTWVDPGGALTPSYRQLADGTIQLRGIFQRPPGVIIAPATIASGLPAAFFPQTGLITPFFVAVDDGTGHPYSEAHLWFDPGAGSIVTETGSQPIVFLDGISWSAIP